MNSNFTRAEIKAQAREQLKGKVWMLFLVTLIIFGISLALAFIPVVGTIALYVITPPLSIGMIYIYLDVTYGDEVEISKLFDGFKMTGKSIALFLWMLLFIFLWSLLFYIPGIIKSYSYSMAFYILAENPDMTAREAIDESRRIMDGHKWEYFVLQLSFILWILLVMVTFGLAAIYVEPYMQLTNTNFYHNIKRQPAPVAEEVYAEPAAEVVE